MLARLRNGCGRPISIVGYKGVSEAVRREMVEADRIAMTHALEAAGKLRSINRWNIKDSFNTMSVPIDTYARMKGL